MAAASGPALTAALSRARVHAAARELAGHMARLRADAIAARRHAAMRVTRVDGRVVFTFHADGDGDGIRTDDILAGRDALAGGPLDLISRYAGVDFGLLDRPIPEVPPGSGVLLPGDDPIRFGRSDLVSFSPWGTSSSGTLYVSDGRLAAAAIVLYGGTGRIRIWVYDRERGAWVR